jgi:hypothetical protein
MKSIIQNSKDRCYMCGMYRPLECHHVYGAAFRKKSEKYGLKVYICHWCHNEPPYGVHQDPDRRCWLQSEVQKIAMRYYGWTIEDFRELFGRNYLDE